MLQVEILLIKADQNQLLTICFDCEKCGEVMSQDVPALGLNENFEAIIDYMKMKKNQHING
jgi:hypothetical protein